MSEHRRDDDPFSPDADPDRLPLRQIAVRAADPAHECHCGGDRESFAGPSLTRRQALLGVGALAALPVAAAATPFPVPCEQDAQKVKPCRHKFCRHYAGADDYYGR